jgi:hypothetical protein
MAAYEPFDELLRELLDLVLELEELQRLSERRAVYAHSLKSLCSMPPTSSGK